MNVETLTAFLGWCTLINFGLLLYWALFIIFAHDWTYRMHSRWFKLSPEKFDSLHYSLMGFFKMGVIIFNLVPYLALRIVT
ncbi:MAG: hypothetical protein GTO67_03445 [Gammaproteobacteria bacterium]|nr:hypothetical protein [Gammaproteobacteria bacterium]NIN37783.1 hypothetical protein [Gammaproteobacteria bacterium]NIO23443.1 hypothetical protein [Gammaproteobacteria bacterium]NIO64059.1 hypothetical protein [Gammaproteobacteria bacterium]NIP47079.1 hypothetical protein [Gammaproteobacteria bacterium]